VTAHTQRCPHSPSCFGTKEATEQLRRRVQQGRTATLPCLSRPWLSADGSRRVRSAATAAVLALCKQGEASLSFSLSCHRSPPFGGSPTSPPLRSQRKLGRSLASVKSVSARSVDTEHLLGRGLRLDVDGCRFGTARSTRRPTSCATALRPGRCAGKHSSMALSGPRQRNALSIHAPQSGSTDS
jgi:hypothetical protein